VPGAIEPAGVGPGRRNNQPARSAH